VRARRNLLEGIGDGFYSVDGDWRIRRISRLAIQHFALPRERVLGRSFWDLFPSTVNMPLSQQVFRAMATRQVMSGEARSVLFEDRPLSFRFFPLGDGLGMVWSYLALPTSATASWTNDPKLDALAVGAIVLRGTGRLLSANGLAAEILKAGDAIYAANRLRATHKPDDNRLQVAIDEALAASARSERFSRRVRVSRLSKGTPYIVQVTSVYSGDNATPVGRPAVLLLITDPGRRPHVDSLELSALFGLTVTEARLVSLLVGGQTLRASARTMNVSFETARTHLARARAKTGSKSQLDLVRMLLTSIG
jgi:DNA-binding CsgD family transcriptional regulator/PAS domain-containing protein